MTDFRDEAAQLVRSLRAYVEWQAETGAHGIPRVGKQGGRLGQGLGLGQPAGATAVRQEPEPSPTPPAHVEAPKTPTAPIVQLDRHVRLPQMAQEVAGCTKCGLSATRNKTVFSRGNPEAALMFIGEAPGADEDEQGLPFVGKAGQLLDRMIAAMGLDPERDVYICNIVKCRPPENRRPLPEEMSSCFPFVNEQIDLVAPKVIVAMGNTAVAAMLDTKLGITRLRGQWKLYRGRIPLMPTYHPSYLLRPSPQQLEAKRQAWDDLQAVMKELGLSLPKKA